MVQWEKPVESYTILTRIRWTEGSMTKRTGHVSNRKKREIVVDVYAIKDEDIKMSN